MLFQVIPFNSTPLSQVKQDADADADDADDADADADLFSCNLCAKKCKGETQMTIMMQASIDCIVAGDLCVKNCGADVKQMTNMPWNTFIDCIDAGDRVTRELRVGAVPGFMGAFVLLDGATKGRRGDGGPGEKNSFPQKKTYRFGRETKLSFKYPGKK